jgi:hypothetical protein
MGILNYSTKIEASKTMAEIQEMLGKKGAHSVSSQYEKGEPVAIFFSVVVKNTPVNFRLPCNWLGVAKVIREDRTISFKFKNDSQAKRTAWRIVKDWVEAQLAIIESGQAQMAEVFLPYAITSNGKTCFELMSSNPQLLLEA